MCLHGLLGQIIKKTSNVLDHAILSIVIACVVLSMTMCSYMIRFNMYLEISMTGQCQINICLT